MSTTTLKTPDRLPLLASALFITLAFFGCRTRTEVQVTTSGDSAQSTNTVTTPSSVTTLREPQATKADSISRDTGRVASDGLKEAPVQFRYVARAETQIPHVNLFVMGIERLDTLIIFHCLIQNGLATSNKGLKPVKIDLTQTQLDASTLKDDRTGKTYMTEASLEVKPTTKAPAKPALISFTLAPSSVRQVDFVFAGVPTNLSQASFTVPNFAFVPGVPITR